MLLLLDIDGVMVPAKSWSPPPVLEDGFSIFTKKAVDALNQIIEKSNANILLTTSHKNRFSNDEWIKIFRKRGIIINDIDKLPENKNNLNRYQEILSWYNQNDDFTDFIIIDDDKSLNNLSKDLKTRLILTDSLIGLTNDHVKKVMNFLNKSKVMIK